jgi:kinesin family protein 15
VAAGDGESHCNVFLCGFCDKSLTSELMDLCEGQTGSGKTHTMWGPMPGSTSDYLPTEDRGITPRIFEQLFSRIQQEERDNVDKHLRYQCRCSFLEIYNEQITDLLEPSLKNLMIREDTKTGVYVESLTEEYVSSMGDVAHLLVRGLANRTIGSTSMNNESSRSHSVLTFVIESHSKVWCTSQSMLQVLYERAF